MTDVHDHERRGELTGGIALGTIDGDLELAGLELRLRWLLRKRGCNRQQEKAGDGNQAIEYHWRLNEFKETMQTFQRSLLLLLVWRYGLTIFAHESEL